MELERSKKENEEKKEDRREMIIPVIRGNEKVDIEIEEDDIVTVESGIVMLKDDKGEPTRRAMIGYELKVNSKRTDIEKGKITVRNKEGMVTKRIWMGQDSEVIMDRFG